LSAPYWRAIWDELPLADDTANTDTRVRNSIQRYKRVTERLGSSAQHRPLREFELDIDSTARAIDLLLLDHHARMAEWVTTHIQPPAARIPRQAAGLTRSAHQWQSCGILCCYLTYVVI
jgi:hypothetical protein